MKKIIITLLIALSAQMVSAYSPQVLRMHCEKDTTKIEALLAEGLEIGIKSGNGLIAFYAEKLLGTPYVAHTLEGEQEYLSINIDQLDCTTFVETLAALSRCTMTNRRSWRDFASMLENIRYRSSRTAFRNAVPSNPDKSAWLFGVLTSVPKPRRRTILIAV